MKVKTIEVRGRYFDIHVNDDGHFFATVDEGQLKAPSLVELTEKLNRATRAIKVAVKFLVWEDGKLRHGTCTGKHAANHNYLVKWADGTNDQLGGWDLKRGVAPEHEEEFARLCTAEDQAHKARAAFQETHTLNIRAAVDAAIENAYRSEEQKA